MNLFIFRRDLRLIDNTALIEALKNGKTACIFIFDPRQVERNSFKSYNSIAFMVGSLKELETEIRKKGGKLGIFYGVAEEVIERLLKRDKKIERVYFNMDYTPFAMKRDKAIAKVCSVLGRECRVYEDILLQGVDEVMNKSGEPYKVFGQYHKAGLRKKIREVEQSGKWSNLSGGINGNFSLKKAEKFCWGNVEVFPAGRLEALRRLRETIADVVVPYPKKRDCLTFLTSQMSPYNKFGCLSVRELYWAVLDRVKNKKHTYLTQLYWRDFFTKIMYFFPETLGSAFYEKYNALKWKPVKGGFQAWCRGMTGFPIVDAGMRQLNAIGWQHNRARLIVASFLAKDLLVDWHLGEKYFSQKLVDIDLSVNTGNWATTVGVGASPLPYFRVMNPWLQQKKYDPDCEYIKEWIPELRDVPAEDIHKWNEKCFEWKETKYPCPIVNHDEQKKKALKMYRSVK